MKIKFLLFLDTFCRFSCFQTLFLLFLDPKVSRNGRKNVPIADPSRGKNLWEASEWVGASFNPKCTKMHFPRLQTCRQMSYCEITILLKECKAQMLNTSFHKFRNPLDLDESIRAWSMLHLQQ